MLLARAGLFLITLLPLALGFGLSAASARLVFIGWGLVAAALLGAIYWRGMLRRWSGWLLAGRLLLLAAALLLSCSWLVGRHFEDTDLGLRSLFPAAYRETWTDPQTARNVAMGLAVAGTLCVIVSHGVARLPGGRNGGSA